MCPPGPADPTAAPPSPPANEMSRKNKQLTSIVNTWQKYKQSKLHKIIQLLGKQIND